MSIFIRLIFFCLVFAIHSPATAQSVGSFYIEIEAGPRGHTLTVDGNRLNELYFEPTLVGYLRTQDFEVVVFHEPSGGTACPMSTHLFHKSLRASGGTTYRQAMSCSDFFTFTANRTPTLEIGDWTVSIDESGFSEGKQPSGELGQDASRVPPAFAPSLEVRPDATGQGLEPYGSYDFQGTRFTIRRSDSAPSMLAGRIENFESRIGSEMILIEVDGYGGGDAGDYFGIAFIPVREDPPMWIAPEDRTFSSADMMCWGQEMAPPVLVGSFCIAQNNLREPGIAAGEAFFVVSEYGSVHHQIVTRLPAPEN